MEATPLFIVCIILIFVIIGIGVGIMCLPSRSTPKGKSNNTIILPSDMKYVPTATPYEDLWRDAKLSSYLDMDFADFRRIEFPKEKGSNESAYRDALIKVLNRGKKGSSHLRSIGDDAEIRKFCIGLTMPNQSVEYRIKIAETLYDYIRLNKIPTLNQGGLSHVIKN